MKKVILLYCLFSLLIKTKVNANHIAGGHLTMQYTGVQNQYIVRAHIYHDPNGVPPPSPLKITALSVSLGDSLIFPLQRINEVSLPVWSCAPIIISPYGLMNESVYEDTINLSAQANDWIIYYQDCCRASQITNLGIVNDNMYFPLRIDNFNFPMNSLPEIIAPTIPMFCLGQPAVYSFTATEIDGDSLVYSLVIPMSGPGTNCVYAQGYSPTHIFSTTTAVSIDSNGNISFTPDHLGTFNIAVKVTEYKNGIISGEVTKDLWFVVGNGIYNPNRVDGKVYFDANNNGVKDFNEKGLRDIIINSPSTGSYTYTIDTSGNYKLYVETGIQEIKPMNVPQYFSSAPPQYNINFTGFLQINSNNDFAIQATPGGSDISISLSGTNSPRPGDTRSYIINVKNIGSDTITATVNLLHDSFLIYSNSNITPSFISADTIKWITQPLQPFESQKIIIELMCDANAGIGQQLYNYVSVLSSNTDQYLLNNFDTLNQTVVNSFDPNMKYASPEAGLNIYDLGIKYINYCINFQNTGTDTARKIVITDQLSSQLDLNTLEFIYSTHACRFEIEKPGILKFTFDSIYLPDSSTNEPESKGFILIRLKTNATVNVPEMYNSAKINFDNNPAVTTNTTITKILNPVSINENIIHKRIIIYPNPANSDISLFLPAIKENEKVMIRITDITGKIVLNEGSIEISNNKKTLDISALASGMYCINVKTGSERWNVRFIKQ